MEAKRAEIAATLDEAQWEWLRGHLERGGIIVVAPGVDIVDAAATIAADDAATVAGWISAGVLGKPSAEDISAWDADPEKRFNMIVVSPYVLIQEKATLQ